MRIAAHALLLLTLAATAAAQNPPSTVPAPPDVSAPPADAAKTASGLATKVIKKSSSADKPTKDDLVTINYTGWTTDGKMFDSSVTKGKPSTFRVAGVIAGFSEGLQLMTVGETRRMWIPQNLAYKGVDNRPKGMLVFDVELLSIPNRAPADVKAPPADAQKTASGLAYKILQPGVGGRHPKPTNQVTVDYSGWTTDGKMFDSSIISGKPATFAVDGVIPGWTEALQLMVEGEKMRIWIPEKIAYGGKQAPYGMLVFDVELIRIQ